tara:strand:+ start:1584 stop:2126 length:543 start_codon:yes stop_codon:yes gene_type:complete
MALLTEPYANTKKKFSKKGLNIRSATDQDLEPLMRLKFAIYHELAPRLSRWYQKHPEAFEKEFYGPRGQDPSKRIYYVIEKPTLEIIGSGGVIQRSPSRAPEVGEITSIYLLLEHRKQGLGYALMNDLIRKSKRLGFEKLFLTTRTEFEAARRLYKKFGFLQVHNPKYKSKNSPAFELKL